MGTKIIPFDIELAKKIQSGEVEGRIVTVEGDLVRIVCFDREGFADSILALITIDDSYEIAMFYTSDGKASKQSRFDIHIELPEETPKHEFKPFDKVLVTQEGWHYWIPSLYRNETPDGKHICIDNLEYDKCIPYEGNQDLVGTTKTPKDYGGE